MTDINKTLTERGTRYGSFEDNEPHDIYHGQHDKPASSGYMTLVYDWLQERFEEVPEPKTMHIAEPDWDSMANRAEWLAEKLRGGSE